MKIKLENSLKGAAKSYLSFKLADEHFAINVMKIMEILEVPQITRVPQAPDYLIGVVNLRGGVLPVIDTRIKFGLERTAFTVNTCIVVLNISVGEDSVMAGALVDSVSEVFEMEEDLIQPSPSIGTKYQSDFIQGMIRQDERFMMLLNIDKVFSTNELLTIKETQEEPVS